MAFLYKVGVLTISDRCSQGQAVDKSGPKLVEIVTNNLGWVVTQQSIVPDEIEEIKGGFQLKGVFSKPSGNCIVAPIFCLLS